MMEVRGVARAQHDTFPYSGMRVLGCFHVCCGAVIFLLGVIDLTITMTSYEKDKVKYDHNYDVIVSLTVASSPLWCGMWFSVTGAVATCISRERAHTLRFFKIVFLVLTILCAALFGPACALLNGLITVLRHDLDSGDLQWLLALLICFLSVLEVVIAIVSASVTCCCAHVRGSQVHVIVNTRGAGGGNSHDNESHHPAHRPQDNTTRWSSTSHHSNNNNNTDNIANNTQNPYHGRGETGHSNNKMTLSDIDPEVEATGSAGRMKPRVEIDENVEDGFAGSYPQLKKWALPAW